MNRVSFLLDEHISPSVVEAIHRTEPSIKVLLVGYDTDAPPKQTPDPELLRFAEQNSMAIVTFDKRTMPLHEKHHRENGSHTWGVFVFADGNRYSVGRIADEIVLIWGTSQAD